MRFQKNNILVLFVVGFFILSCKNSSTSNIKELDENLVKKLQEIVEIDQIAAGIPKGKYKEMTQEEWQLFKDSVFDDNYNKVKNIFNEYDFVGFDVAGERGSQNFWLIVQHLDKYPEFQKNVLVKMKEEVLKKNADAKNYAYLTDRIKLNFKEEQIYGTQVDYNWKVCQAFPKNLQDSINVNKRRQEIGLEPLEVYLNEMSKFHFEINKEAFLSLGVKKPKLYGIK